MSIAIPVQLTLASENAFDDRVRRSIGGPLRAVSLDTIQVNIGLTCDLACRHCHVESSPARTEQMTWETMELVLDAAQRACVSKIDITGGAPEMNPHFRDLVGAARRRGFIVLVRTNLTIMTHDGYQDMPEFYRDHRVHLVASLPCYLAENVKKQRGLHVYDESIGVIRRLNEVGYALDEDLSLDLVYNPGGALLPPPQATLEALYRRELDERFGIRFSKLYAITNMPIGRFLHDLERDSERDNYTELLCQSFNTNTLDELMCRNQVHVSYDGTLHDCDFNYALAMPTNPNGPNHIRDFDPKKLVNRKIATAGHCFGCTAGNGSSCGGALA